MSLLDRFFAQRAITPREAAREQVTAARRALLDEQIAASLASRRTGRAERQAAAEKREREKHHNTVINDPIVRDFQAGIITKGEK